MVVGEVARPGSYSVQNERISIIEAIGLAGDLTIYGDRKNVLLIREQNGKRMHIDVDLTNKQLFDSPYFYLSQNDVIYVQPNKTRVNSSAVGPNTSVILSGLSIIISLLAIFLI
jgi:polysaccharide export outer membrane protein